MREDATCRHRRQVYLIDLRGHRARLFRVGETCHRLGTRGDTRHQQSPACCPRCVVGVRHRHSSDHLPAREIELAHISAAACRVDVGVTAGRIDLHAVGHRAIAPRLARDGTAWSPAPQEAGVFTASSASSRLARRRPVAHVHRRNKKPSTGQGRNVIEMTGSRSNYAAAPACGPSLALRQEFEELYRFPATVIDHEKLPCAVSPPGQVDAVRQQLLPDLPRAGRIAPTDPPSRRRWRRIEWHDRAAIKIDQLQYARLRLDTVGSALQMHVAGDHAVCPGDGLQIFRERHTTIWLQIARGFARLPRRGSGVTGCDQRRERDQDGKGAS